MATPRIDGTLPLTVRAGSITGKIVVWAGLGHPSRRTANKTPTSAARRVSARAEEVSPQSWRDLHVRIVNARRRNSVAECLVSLGLQEKCALVVLLEAQKPWPPTPP
jgi:ribosomal protein S11